MAITEVKNNSILARARNQKYLLLLTLPAVLWVIVFNYIPMYGIVVSFQNFDVLKGFFHSSWVGLDNYKELFSDSFFLQSFKNTIVIGILKLIAGFPAPILFALLINEISNVRFKKLIQSVSYLPNFISWVFVVGFLYAFFSSTGAVNTVLKGLGMTQDSIIFMADKKAFLAIVILSDVWKNFGWGSIIYLANIAAIDQGMYEAAVIDGANRWERIWYITLPSIKGTVVMLLILTISNLVNQNFDQLFLMTNPLVTDVGQIIDVYAYNVGFKLSRFSYGTAIGFFKSVLSMILLCTANITSRKLTGESLF